MVKNEIKVFARLKPEVKKKNIVNYQIHRRPKKHFGEDYLVLNGAQKPVNEYIDNRPESWNFAFYKIFDHDIGQNEIFENVAQPVVQSVLNGYNATVFAYGQTGSGKTFSITGDPERYEDRGILPRTIQYLFETMKKNPDNLYSVEIAYLEIYNENGYDLLDPKHEVVTKLEDLPRVTIQEDETGTLHLKNLNFRRVENEKDALALLFLGDANRAISETPMNPQSSRSHCIFTIAISVKQSGAQQLTKAKMHLVDLAGSERVYKCCISGTILTEAKYINLSLHYLEQVIVCLGQQNVSHIPYRNSLLTAILRDSLGGNCLTTMLATLSLNTSNLEETISTCRFSQRVALIKNDVNLVFDKNPEDENRFLKIEVERLRNRIAQLTQKTIISEELTADEKQNLNHQIDKFLESNAVIDWENDNRKITYCFEVLRENLKIRNGDKNCSEDPGKDLNYYRNLVIQRDKEISALINMLKKTGRSSSKNSTDPGSFKACENQSEISPNRSLIAKKVRLRDLTVEARSIAELIKNGKASIGDLRIRMTNVNPVEIQPLHEYLQVEQLKLSHNLSLLKSLKTEAKELKKVLIEENEGLENFYTNSTSHNCPEELLATRIETDSNNFNIDNDVCRQEYLVASQAMTSTKSMQKRDDDETFLKKILSLKPGTIENPSKGTKKNTEDCEVLSTPLAKELNNFVEVLSPRNKITCRTNLESNAAKLPKSKSGIFVKMSSKNCCNDSDSRLSLPGERFNVTKTLPNGESRRSSFRAPAYLRDMMRSDGDSVAESESLPSERNGDPSLEKTEVYNTLIKKTQGSKADTSISDIEISLVDVPMSTIHSAKSDATNFSKVQKVFDNIDHWGCKNDRPFSGHEIDCDQTDQFRKTSITTEKYLRKKSKESDGEIQKPIFISDENREGNKIEGDPNSLTSEDDSFMKSLPLTGDPEIDEEIIAFYRAKRSGGIY